MTHIDVVGDSEKSNGFPACQVSFELAWMEDA